MQIVKVCLLFMVIVIIECKQPRQNLKKEVKSTNRKWTTSRGEVFENLFNVYDPAYLAVVWPKITNGVHILVDHRCWEDMTVMLRDLTEGRAWAYTAQDASGRYGSALFSGDRFWLGSKEQCWTLDQDYIDNNGSSLGEVHDAVTKNMDLDGGQDWRWTGHHEDSTQRTVVERQAPYRLAYTSVQIGLNITKTSLVKTYDVTLGVCLPRSCSPRDVTSIVNFSIMINDNFKSNKTNARTAKVTSVRLVSSYNALEDNGAIILIAISTLLIILSLSATVIDLDWIKCLPYATKSMTFDLEKYNTEPKKKMAGRNDSKHDINDYDKAIDNVSYMGVEFRCPPTLQLDMNCPERHPSCARCGKYRKQCNNPRSVQNIEKLAHERKVTHLNQYNSTASLNTNVNKSLFCRLLLCFSLSYCWRRVVNKNVANKDLAVVHGVKIVATLWVMFVHVAVLVDHISDTSGDVNELNNIYYILLTGTIAFDTLFFVSGLFSSHHFFFLKSQYSMKELVGARGACGHVLQFVCFVTNRVIRLLPTYGFAILITAVVSRASQASSARALPVDIECDRFWWRNLLYLTNLYPNDQVWWYMSAETWLHCACALLLSTAAAPLRARVLAGLTLVCSLAATVVDASAAYFDFAHPFSTVFEAYTTIIVRPWSRVTPYFIGVLAGWLIHVLQGKLKVSKITSSLLWTASCSFIFASSAIPLVGLPWLGAWLHLSWPVALLWPLLVATTAQPAGAFRRFLTSSTIAALSRLCYSMLLLHVCVSRGVLLATDAALCSHTLCIWLYFSGITVFTILAALLVSLFVEMPSCSLLRRLSDCAR